MSSKFQSALEAVTRVRGVRGAMLVAGDDGLVVAESLMEGVRGNALAALAASLAQRFRRASERAACGQPQFIHLQASTGSLLAAPAPSGMLLVIVADADINVGLARLEMLKAAEVVS